MALSDRALETLMDLVENKLACLEVCDRDDAREVANLEHCLNELQTMSGRPGAKSAPILEFSSRSRNRGRLRAAV